MLSAVLLFTRIDSQASVPRGDHSSKRSSPAVHFLLQNRQQRDEHDEVVQHQLEAQPPVYRGIAKRISTESQPHKYLSASKTTARMSWEEFGLFRMDTFLSFMRFKTFQLEHLDIQSLFGSH